MKQLNQGANHGVPADVISVSVVTDTNAYADGDCVGGELSSSKFPNRFILKGITILDKDAKGSDYKVWVMSSPPGSTTVHTDNAALDIKDVDCFLLQAVIPISTDDSLGNIGISYIRDMDLPLVSTSPDNKLYFYLEVGASVTYSTAAAIQVLFHIVRCD